MLLSFCLQYLVYIYFGVQFCFSCFTQDEQKQNNKVIQKQMNSKNMN